MPELDEPAVVDDIALVSGIELTVPDGAALLDVAVISISLTIYQSQFIQY
jgi:hypothetical protein